MCMDTCAWCGFADDCAGVDGAIMLCIPKDIFVDSDAPACSIYADEEGGILSDIGYFTI